MDIILYNLYIHARNLFKIWSRKCHVKTLTVGLGSPSIWHSNLASCPTLIVTLFGEILNVGGCLTFKRTSIWILPTEFSPLHRYTPSLINWTFIIWSFPSFSEVVSDISTSLPIQSIFGTGSPPIGHGIETSSPRLTETFSRGDSIKYGSTEKYIENILVEQFLSQFCKNYWPSMRVPHVLKKIAKSRIGEEFIFNTVHLT